MLKLEAEIVELSDGLYDIVDISSDIFDENNITFVCKKKDTKSVYKILFKSDLAIHNNVYRRKLK